jgi:hypothetical protein
MNMSRAFSLRCATAAAVSAALLLGLAACATATPYQPQQRGYGYAEQRLETNRYKVVFAGNSSTPRQTVENYLLYRAAEVTLLNGYDYFVLADQNTQSDTRYQETFTGIGAPYYWYPRGYYGAVGSSTANPITEFEAQANILVFKGTKPADNFKAFDARDLKANLEPYITRPVVVEK